MSIFMSSVENSSASDHVVVQIRGTDCRVEALVIDGELTVNVYPGVVGPGEDVMEHPLAIYESRDPIEPTMFIRDNKLKTWRVREVDADEARLIRAMPTL